MARNKIDEVNFVSLFGKPKGVCAGAAAGIDNDLLPPVKVSRYDALGPLVFEGANAISQPAFLVVCLRVVLNYLVRHLAVPESP
jgi:hypothetical protein